MVHTEENDENECEGFRSSGATFRVPVLLRSRVQRGRRAQDYKLLIHLQAAASIRKIIPIKITVMNKI